MQTNRRSSVPSTSSSSVPARKSSTTISSSSTSSVKTKAAVQKQPSTTSSEAAQTTTAPSAASFSATSTSSVSTSPIILSPVSQLPKTTRRSSRVELPSDKTTPYDPEHFNPDGSLRTVHRLPGFEQAYAQAQKARYIRHRTAMDKEKELSVNQIFDKS